MNSCKPPSLINRTGFTLTEVMVAATLSTMVLLGLITFFSSTYSYWYGVNLRAAADSDVNIAMSRMVYGMGNRFGLRAASVQSVEIIPEDNGGWTLNYDTGGATPQNNSFAYSATDQTILFNPGSLPVGRDIADAQITKDAGMLNITLRVDKKRGKLEASREIKTTVNFRNRRN